MKDETYMRRCGNGEPWRVFGRGYGGPARSLTVTFECGAEDLKNVPFGSLPFERFEGLSVDFHAFHEKM